MGDDFEADKFLSCILDESDGFDGFKSSLTWEEARFEMAKYALACMHDMELADEAFKICEPK